LVICHSSNIYIVVINDNNFSIPFILTKEDFTQNFTFIDIGGSTINWMRYIGVWIIIYFMYKILQENSTIQKEKLELENIAKTTELELLKTQLNPHFCLMH